MISLALIGSIGWNLKLDIEERSRCGHAGQQVLLANGHLGDVEPIISRDGCQANMLP